MFIYWIEQMLLGSSEDYNNLNNETRLMIMSYWDYFHDQYGSMCWTYPHEFMEDGNDYVEY